MKKCSLLLLLIFFLLAAAPAVKAQCSICSRTTQQMGAGPAKALNSGIIYLALAPLAIGGILGYRWWKSNENPPTP
jgi:hypothetical protein